MLDTAENSGLGKLDCPNCGGLGYVVPDVPPAHHSFGKAIPCSCRDAERVGAKMNQLLEVSQIGMLQSCTFETFLPEGHGLKPAQQVNLKLAYEKTFAYAKNPKGWIVFSGTYGCGKTHLAAAIANYRLSLGYPVLFINTPDLLDYLRSAYNPNVTVSYNDRFEQVRNAPLLILDDMGTENATEWAQEKLFQIINHRYHNQLPTVVTTNRELKDFEGRIYSRLVDFELVQTIPISAPDFRRSKGSHAHDKFGQSDLSSLHLHEDKSFEKFDIRSRELPRGKSDNLRRALELAKEYAENPKGWLVFYSVSYGNGKTHLAAAIANQVNRQGESVLFIGVPDLLDHLRATFNPNSGLRYDKMFEEVKSAKLLVLDDLGTESATAWAREKLYQLFNYRYNAQLPTVITTAVHIEELDPRLVARMLDERRCTMFAINVSSYMGPVVSKSQKK